MTGLIVYWLIFVLMMIGLFMTIDSSHLVRKVVGVTILQIAVFMLYIGIANVEGASVPILKPDIHSYSNPLPHVLILTAIVVGIATVALALALIVRIREAYGSVEEPELDRIADDDRS